MSNLHKDLATAKTLLALSLINSDSKTARAEELAKEITQFLYPKPIDANAERLAAFRDRITAAKQPKPLDATDQNTCPRCRHAAHENTVCYNMASDNDCNCTYPNRGWVAS
jgi:hypothetical protein